ncbi:MAG: hypothetical protein R3E77_10435 [Steroidobacteraceae bacterium]
MSIIAAVALPFMSPLFSQYGIWSAMLTGAVAGGIAAGNLQGMLVGAIAAGIAYGISSGVQPRQTKFFGAAAETSKDGVQGLASTIRRIQQAGVEAANAARTHESQNQQRGQSSPEPQRPVTNGCIGTPIQCGGENFWRDFAAGRFLSSFADPLALFNDGVNPLSDVWLTPREQNDARFVGFLSVATAGSGYITGVEVKFGQNFRFALFGNRTGNELGRYPHYHRRGTDAATGETLPGQGIGRHRPWETKSPDTSFWDRF